VASGGPRSRLGFAGEGSVAMAKYMDVRSEFTGRTADQPRRARHRAVEID
jgi:hypothetical protein